MQQVVITGQITRAGTLMQQLVMFQENGTGLPDLSGLNLGHLNVQDNNLSFEDIVPNIGSADFTYPPQAKVGEEETQQVAIGADHTISVSVGGANNTYQWYKDDVAISGADETSYTITGFASADAGLYHCLITNSQATLLSLESEDIILTIGTALASSITIDATNIDENYTCTLSGIISETHFSSDNVYNFAPETLPGTANLVLQNQSATTQNIRFDVDENYNISNVQVEVFSTYVPLYPSSYSILQDGEGKYSILKITQIVNICMYYPVD